MLSLFLQPRVAVLPVCLIALGGCRLPWSSENTVPAIQTVSKAPPDAADSVSAVPSAGAPSNQAGSKPYHLPQPEPSQEEAMAAVLADLEEIGAIDPAAREALMEDLRAAKLSNWPLIVQSFRAALAYREQLIAREMPGTELAEDSRPAAQLSNRADQRERPPTDRPVQAGSIIPLQQTVPAQEPQPAPAGPSAENPLRAAMHQTPGQAAIGAPRELRRHSSPEPQALGPRPIAGKDDAWGERLAMGSQNAEAPIRQAPVRQAAYTLEVPAQPADPFDLQPTGKSDPSAGTDGSRRPLDRSWKDELSAAIGQLEAATNDAPATGEDVRKHALLRMLYLVADRREDALRPIPGIAPAQQDYWSKQLFALGTYLDTDGPSDARRRATAAQSQLAEAAAILGELGSMSVHHLTFCTEVLGFGVYTPINQPQFAPGQRVLLYAEVRNYRSVRAEKGFQTVLSTSYAIHDEGDQRVAGGEFPEVVDDCRNRRRDFHIQYGVILPSHLRSGRYHLELIIEDVLGNKIGRSRAEFEIK